MVNESITEIRGGAMKKNIKIAALNNLLQEWKLESTQCTFSKNRCVNGDEHIRLNGKQAAIDNCCMDLWNLMNS